MDLIEDLDGAPLPGELQRDTELYAEARRALIGTGAFEGDLDGLEDALDDVLRVIAPHLWPYLPSNDHSDANRLERLIRVACYDPGRFTPRGREFTEDVWRWQARAVQIVVNDPARAAAAL